MEDLTPEEKSDATLVANEADAETAKPKKEKKSVRRAREKAAPADFSTPEKPKKHFGVLSVCAVAIVACGLGFAAGAFVPGLLSKATTHQGSGQTTVAADALDSTVMGTYTYNGQTYNITVADVFEQMGSQSTSQQEDGSYTMPAADGALAYARNAIVTKYAADQGLSVSDDDMNSYAQDTIQSTDYSQIASSYGMTEDEVKNLIKQSALIKKLHDQVVKTTVPTQPTAPTEPESGAESTPTADYAKYIIDLAGDEWDATNNTWKSTDGTYATALSSYTITNDSATYDAAKAAYYVAYQQYTTAQSESSKEWTDFVNGLLKDANITIFNLVS